MSNTSARSRISFVVRTLAALVFIVAVLYISWFLYMPVRPTMAASEVQSVEIKFESWRDETNQMDFPAAHLELTEESKIQSLLNVFQHSKRGSDHKCASIGSIVIVKKDGVTEVLEMLPGHDDVFFEYRMGGRLHRIDRVPLESLLRQWGIERLPPP